MAGEEFVAEARTKPTGQLVEEGPAKAGGGPAARAISAEPVSPAEVGGHLKQPRGLAVTRDGTEITLLLNAGLLLDVAQLDATGAAGIGLFRTEIQLLARNTKTFERT